MPTLDLDDTDSVEAADYEELKEGDLRLRDLRRGDALLFLATATLLFAIGVIGLRILLEEWALTWEAGVGVALAVLGFWFGLRGLQELDCILREDQTCRKCEKELDRWRADP